jgi:hypothetical protein
MKKLYAFAAALFLGTAAFAQTSHSVTFQVDLGSTAASANGVHVAGSFQSWDPSTTGLTQVGTSSIYQATVSIAAGSYEYKFINGNTWSDVESVPSESQVVSVTGNANDNRWVVISSDTTLPAVTFSGNAPANHNLMVAHVDLSLQTVAADGGKVAGSFNSWTDTDLADFNGDGTWETHIFVYDTASAQEFKYKNGASGWESVPSSCANGGGNREFANTGDAVMTNCFNMCGPCVVLPTYELTINVDLSSLTACSTIDAVTLAGPINGWSGSDTLTDPDMDGVYSITFASIDSGSFEYKARYHVGGTTNWEGGGNKVVTVSADTTLPARCFGNDVYGACAPTPATADVTFIVDFTQAAYTPADTVWVIGSFAGWDAANAIAMVPHTAPGQYIATLAAYCPGSLEYRFSNGDPSDAANHEPVDAACGVDNGVGGYNRYFARTGAADTLRHTYATCSFVSVEEAALDMISVRPNPMTETATLSLGMNDVFEVRVMDITGRVVAGMSSVQGDVVLSREGMNSGMYFVTVANSKGEARTLKVVVE